MDPSPCIFSQIDEDITLVLDNLPVGIVRINHSGKCVYANRYIISMFGAKDANQVYECWMKAIHKDDMNGELEASREFLHNYKECSSTLRVFNNQLKEYRWHTNKRTIIRSKDGSLSFMNTLQDIHEIKVMELKLMNETRKSSEAYNHKSRFLANMSHEIRTPLNGIIGMLTLLEDTPLNTDQQDYIAMVKECSFNLMTVINDILDFSKLEVGKIQLDIKTINLQECIDSTNDIIMSKVYEKSLEYISNIHPDVPTYIKGDSNRIKQVLLNLLSNAIKFTDHGSIILSVKTINANDPMTPPSSDLSSTSVFLRFDITDTGRGIDTTDSNKLFKSFSQLDNYVSSKIYQGTGLGLAISKELVDLMRGSIWLDWSEINKGSRFSFIVQTEVEQNALSEAPHENVLAGAHVLIVDDNMHNRMSLSGIVSKWGMRPYAFHNAEEALYFTRINKFDIGLIDICMPKINGEAFASKLRDQIEHQNHSIPLIALSSLGDKSASSSKYFCAHLTKPIKEHKLKQICISNLAEYRKKNVTLPSSDKTPGTLQIQSPQLAETKANIRVIVAEDVYINQRVIVSFLHKMGFQNVYVVENGQQCLDALYKNESSNIPLFDVVLLDIRMPVLNGELVIKEIHKRSCDKKPYVVAVTAYGMKEDKEKYLRMGFDDYIAKPVTNAQLISCMNRFVEKVVGSPVKI